MISKNNLLIRNLPVFVVLNCSGVREVGIVLIMSCIHKKITEDIVPILFGHVYYMP